MRKSQNFWDKNARRYDRFMRKDETAYEQLYELLRPVVRHKTVPEPAGFPLHSKWTSDKYPAFLRENGRTVQKSAVLKASFPLTYAECLKLEGT